MIALTQHPGSLLSAVAWPLSFPLTQDVIVKLSLSLVFYKVHSCRNSLAPAHCGRNEEMHVEYMGHMEYIVHASVVSMAARA